MTEARIVQDAAHMVDMALIHEAERIAEDTRRYGRSLAWWRISDRLAYWWAYQGWRKTIKDLYRKLPE